MIHHPFAQRLLNLIYPEGLFCGVCGTRGNQGHLVCEECQASMIAYEGYELAAFEYEGAAAEIVRIMKYGNRPDLSSVLTHHMAYRLLSSKSQVQLAVGVPMSFRRKIRRGYNQADLLARQVARICGIPFVPGALVRLRETPPQASLGRELRLTALQNTIAAAGKSIVGKDILLVDDITTTGATIAECTRALMAGGANSVVPLTACKVRLE